MTDHDPDELAPDEPTPSDPSPAEPTLSDPSPADPDSVGPNPADANSVGLNPDESLDADGDGAVALVDWEQTGRRVGRVLTVLGIVVLVAWLAVGLLGDEGLRLRLLAEFVGLALLVAFVAEVVVVGGAAVRGMLRAGERGERLSGSDVSLFPPQLRRRR